MVWFLKRIQIAFIVNHVVNDFEVQPEIAIFWTSKCNTIKKKRNEITVVETSDFGFKKK